MKTQTRRSVAVLVTVALLSGCAGRPANPVMVHQYGDEQRSCRALEKEIAFTEEEIQRLIPETRKAGKNTVLGITGFFLLVPWFFMDLSKAEQIEVNALRQRYNHLVILASEKECGFEREEIPEFDKPREAEPETPEKDDAEPVDAA